MSESEFNQLDENRVIQLAQEGDKEASQYILNKYRKIVLKRARSYYLTGGDHEDLIQEGMIGLLKAIWDFKADRNVRFDTFAGLCVERQIQTAVTTANRQKHQALNQSVSIYSSFSKEESDEIIEHLEGSKNMDPGISLINDEAIMMLVEKMKKELSDFEKKVLFEYIKGESYHAIAEILGCKDKSVDNALQRIRKKIGDHL